MTRFWQGFKAGLLAATIFFAIIVGSVIYSKCDKENMDYEENQTGFDWLWEDYDDRDPDEFVDAIPDVRGAADGAAADFIRKRNEAVQRFRGRLAD